MKFACKASLALLADLWHALGGLRDEPCLLPSEVCIGLLPHKPDSGSCVNAPAIYWQLREILPTALAHIALISAPAAADTLRLLQSASKRAKRMHLLAPG